MEADALKKLPEMDQQCHCQHLGGLDPWPQKLPYAIGAAPSPKKKTHTEKEEHLKKLLESYHQIVGQFKNYFYL